MNFHASDFMRTLTDPDRLKALYGYQILDTPREEKFDAIARFAGEICETPLAFINFVDADRVWSKSSIGADVGEVPAKDSFCAHTIQCKSNQLVVIPDTMKDARSNTNPYVVGPPHVRFYAGAIIRAIDEKPLGVICVADFRGKQLNPLQGSALIKLADLVQAVLESRVRKSLN